jgi:hypothetical protein
VHERRGGEVTRRTAADPVRDRGAPGRGERRILVGRAEAAGVRDDGRFQRQGVGVQRAKYPR